MPAGKPSTLYRPCASVVAEKSCFVTVLKTVISALAITLPFGSVIFPAMLPPAACAMRKGIESTASSKRRESFFEDIIRVPRLGLVVRERWSAIIRVHRRLIQLFFQLESDE